MKTIKVSELKAGDIFAKEIKLIGREAFQVIDLKPGKTTLSLKAELRTIKKSL